MITYSLNSNVLDFPLPPPQNLALVVAAPVAWLSIGREVHLPVEIEAFVSSQETTIFHEPISKSDDGSSYMQL